MYRVTDLLASRRIHAPNAGRAFTPVIAVLVMVTGVAAGTLLRKSQRPLDRASSTEASQRGSTIAELGPDAADTGNHGLLRYQHTVPLLSEDIEETVESPALTVSSSGIVYVAWASNTSDDERTLWMSRSKNEGQSWEAPREVLQSPIHVAVSEMRGKRIERRLRLMPLLAAHQENLVLTWVQGGQNRSDVMLLLATSDDEGQSFSDSIRVHQSDQSRPSFTALAVSKQGDVACAWLDNRDDVQQCYMAVKTHGRSDFSPEILVDPGQDKQGICPCCPTSLSFAADGSAWVAYRGQVDGMRDIWTARWQSSNDAVSAPIATNVPTWKFEGCPHDVPAVVALPQTTLVAWMDAHDGLPRVYINRLTKRQHGAWEHEQAQPLDPTFIGSQEQPCLAVDWSGGTDAPVIHAAWAATPNAVPAPPTAVPTPSSSPAAKHAHDVPTMNSNALKAIYYAVSFDGGKRFQKPIAINAQAGIFQSRPKLAIGPSGQLYVSYFELSDQGKRLVVGQIDTQVNRDTQAPGLAGMMP